MKAMLAVDPKYSKDQLNSSLMSQLSKLKEQGIITSLSGCTVIHPALYSGPIRWFEELKKSFQSDMERDLSLKVKAKLAVDAIKVLVSSSSTTEDVAQKFVSNAEKEGTELSVIFGSNQKQFPHWFLGSFTEIAIQMARTSILVLKPQLKESQLASKPVFVVAIDTTAKVSPKVFAQLLKMAKTAHAGLHFVSVLPPLMKKSTAETTLEALHRIQKKFTASGIVTHAKVLPASSSVAQAIVDHADDLGAWGLITLACERSKLRRFFLGSTTKKILVATRRPFFHLTQKN